MSDTPKFPLLEQELVQAIERERYKLAAEEHEITLIEEQRRDAQARCEKTRARLKEFEGALTFLINQ